MCARYLPVNGLTVLTRDAERKGALCRTRTVMLTSDAGLETWLTAEAAEALKLQRLASDDAITLLAGHTGKLEPERPDVSATLPLAKPMS